MSFKKQILAIAAVGALSAATAVPAMALENEFHGMYRAFGFMSNAYNGTSAITLAPGAHTNAFAEQRARIQYIAKANDNLKLITHFELDSRFGGASYGTSGKYAGSGDAGQLDADSVSLETKNVFLDFNEPFSGTNFKVGVQPWADAYGSTFALFDGAGIQVSRKFGAFTPTFGWFRVNDTSLNGGSAFGGQSAGVVGKKTTDIVVVDGKFAVNKDLTVGASYYGVYNDAFTGTTFDSATASAAVNFRELHMIGANASAKFGPAAVNVFGAYQVGEQTPGRNISAFGAGATGKVKVGPGNANLAFLYLSGDKDATTGDNEQSGWQSLSANTTYFAPANMWLMIRSPQSINSSEGLGGNFLNKGGRGFMGFFGGYEYAAGKFFANANAGAGFVPNPGKTGGVEQDDYLGTEANIQIGYKVYDSLSVSLIGAYLFLGDAVNSPTDAKRLSGTGASNFTAYADDPYLTAVQFNYVF
ncbi:porin [Geomonas sp. RF6]|uniref:porin n=1 Tax=Geomonas sp. RF6 TaxID=2897342 RepID=UPI001E55A3DC|nr:porin [Geomonas sp. RF6]UFS68520.1 porin [Geomonas sp. RF6]